MLKFLLYIISYGSFLLLLMPRGRANVICAFVIFVLGVCAAVYKKARGAGLNKDKVLPIYILYILYTVFISACLGYVFYFRWLQAYIVLRISSVLHISHETLLIIGALLLTVMSAYFICAVVCFVRGKFFGANHSFARSVADCLIASAVTVATAQVMLGLKPLSMGALNFACGCLAVSAAILLLYCLIGKIIPSACIGTGFFMLISTINTYVFYFRDRLFDPTDIFSAATALEVTGNYDFFPFPPTLIFGWGIYAIMIMALLSTHRKEKPGLNVKKRVCSLVLCAACAVPVCLRSHEVPLRYWSIDGALINGYILDFVAKFRTVYVQKPEGYSPEAIVALSEKYADEKDAHETNPEKLPNIIVIMDESFSDLGVIADFSTNTEVMPFISSLKENTVLGHTLVSVFGGNTANSEYEFLTGNSLAWMTPNAVPYMQYIHEPSYSVISYLKSSFNYKCVAMHPYWVEGWNRLAVYDYLGFDESYFIYDFPVIEYVRQYASDSSMFDFVISTHEEHLTSPLLVFGVTMQNHGSYIYTDTSFTNDISITGHEGEFFDVEQYLSLIRETDRAVEKLITYFQNVDDEVLIVFFGDHLPKLDNSFYETFGSATDTLDEQQKRYEVPFFIWANYDIEEKYVECSSLNYLMNYVYEAAGIELPPYNKFLRDMEEVIPSINANGYYSLEKGCYLPFEEADGEERQWLDEYEALQYNSIFDKMHRNDVFFPAPN